MHDTFASKSFRHRLLVACVLATPLAVGASVASCTSDDSPPHSECANAAGVPCGLDASFLEDGFAAFDATGLPPFDSATNDGTVADGAIDATQSGDDTGSGDDASDAALGTDANDGASAIDGGELDAADANDANDAADAGPQPMLLAGSQVNPYYIALGGGYVYCGSGNSTQPITRVSVDGGAATPIGNTGPSAMTADANNLYWATSVGDIYQVAHNSTTVLKIATGQYEPNMIATDGTYVYWNQNGTNASFLRVPIGGGADAGKITPGTLTFPSGITFVGGQTYVAIANTGNGFGVGTISVLPGDGGLPVTVVSGRDGPVQLINDGARLYWVEDTGVTPNGMFAKPLDGGALITFTQNEIHPFIATDGTWLYYTDTEYVLKTAADGTFGTGKKLYTTSYPSAIAQDAAHVYWIDKIDDAIYRGDKY